MSIDSLRRRVDKALAVVEDRLEQQKTVEEEQSRVVVRLPIKDNEPPVPYQRGMIYFFVPEHRLNEVA